MTVDLARTLLRQQHPDLADLRIVEAGSGWDNVMLRLGDDLALRLPRRTSAVALTEHEQRWLPVLAPRLPLPIPAPVRVGRPGSGYPWPWSVVPWIAGAPAESAPPDDPLEAAEVLGGFLAALHRPAPPDAPTNPFRGVPLADRAAGVDVYLREYSEQRAADVDIARLRDVWEGALAAPIWNEPPRWIHGDLHPRNVVVADGAIAGVVDFGDVTAGDPATDLSAAWTLLPPEAASRLRSAYGAIDHATWTRARGWALLFGLLLARTAARDGDAGRARTAATTLQRVLSDTTAGVHRSEGA